MVGILLFGLGSCGGYIIAKPLANSYVRKHKETLLPEDFFSKDHTLVVVLDKSNTDYNKRVKKKIPKLYAGNIDFMTLAEYDSKDAAEEWKYSFRYVDRGTYSYPGHTQSAARGREFYMYDRSTEKKYKCGVYSSFYMRIVEAYFKRLDKWRLES